MPKYYLCKDCVNNNSGWCIIKKKQGLKDIIDCDTKTTKKVVENTIELLSKALDNSDINMRDLEDFSSFEDLLQARIKVETHYEWRKWIDKIPYINFDSDWDVKAIPPFSGAIIRYLIKDKSSNKVVSIYLDCYDELGLVGEPYWELYPDNEGGRYKSVNG